MAVTSAEEYSVHGTRGNDGYTYESVYQVLTDNDDDGPVTVHNHFKSTATLPWRGDQFMFGNDSDTTSLCISVVAKRPERQSRRLWHVTCNFGPQNPSLDEEQDEAGNPTDDPLEFRPVLTSSRMFVPRVAERAKYLEGYQENDPTDSGSRLKAIRGGVTPMNSAYTPFDPPATIDHEIQIWRLRFNTAQILSKKDNQAGFVIEDKWAINIFRVVIANPSLGGLDVFQADRYEAKVTNVDLQPMITNGIAHWQVEYEFAIDTETWRPEYADRGYDARLSETKDPTGKGTTLGSEVLDDGVAERRPILDKFGRRISSPVNLDGNGQPQVKLPGGGMPPTVYGRWSLDPEKEVPMLVQYFALAQSGFIILNPP